MHAVSFVRDPRRMKVLAFDVGIKNMAFVAMTGERAVLAWENVAVPGDTLEANVRAVHALLRARPALFEHADVVLIERQPPLNRKMSCVAHALFMFFLDRCPAVHFVDPKVKTSGFADFLAHRPQEDDSRGNDSRGNAYRRRKAESVACARHALAGSPWLAVLDGSRKLDDLCDAYASAYSWIGRQPVRV